MSEQFPYADIIIIALVAVFILLRLRSVLGQKMGDENNDFFRPKPSDQTPKPDGQKNEAIVQILGKIDRIVKEKPKDAKNNDDDKYAKTNENEPIGKDIAELKTADPMFNASHFLEGAKMAFEMVFDAFVKGDKNTLGMLLTQDICADFVSHVDEREKQETKMETTLLSVTPQEIKRINVNKNLVRIAVQFESEQVTVERGKAGEIISGNPSDVQHVIDEWVFERDISSKNPNWKIIET